MTPIRNFCVIKAEMCAQTVSYTHLDVYKRQSALYGNHKITDLMVLRKVRVCIAKRFRF